MNAVATIAVDFRPAYQQIDKAEKAFVDGYVADVEHVAEKTGQRLLAVLANPLPFKLDARAYAYLARPMVRAAIADRVHSLAEASNVTTYRTIKEAACVAYSNIGNYTKVNDFGEPEINLSNATPEQMAAVKSFEWEDKPNGGRKVKFVLHDKMAAIDKLMRYQGLLSDSGEHFNASLRSEKPAKSAAIPANASEDAAADLYAQTL